MIPKRIFTIWLSEDKELPDIVAECIPTHELPGYEHWMITLETCFKSSRYISECLAAKNWVKASDFLRIFYLYTEGGIYLDADVKVLKDFDDLLDNKVFLCKEESTNYFVQAVLGAEAGHPVLHRYLGMVERNFRGDGDLVFEAGMRLWTDVVTWANKEDLGIRVYPQEYFMPFDNITKRERITENTRTYHYFMNSWGAV